MVDDDAIECRQDVRERMLDPKKHRLRAAKSALAAAVCACSPHPHDHYDVRCPKTIAEIEHDDALAAAGCHL